MPAVHYKLQFDVPFVLSSKISERISRKTSERKRWTRGCARTRGTRVCRCV